MPQPSTLDTAPVPIVHMFDTYALMFHGELQGGWHLSKGYSVVSSWESWSQVAEARKLPSHFQQHCHSPGNLLVENGEARDLVGQNPVSQGVWALSSQSCEARLSRGLALKEGVCPWEQDCISKWAKGKSLWWNMAFPVPDRSHEGLVDCTTVWFLCPRYLPFSYT